MINKVSPDLASAVSAVQDGSVVMIGGFGDAGSPTELIHAVVDRGVSDLTVISNNAGNGLVGLAALLNGGAVRKIICSYPRSSHSVVFEELYRAGRVELETVPQGTLAERIRAAGAGIGGFYTKTSAGTPVANGKEIRIIDGEEFVFEAPLKADVALVKAQTADRWGNLTFRLTARNFGPIMCMAAAHTIVQVRRIVPLGAIDPESVVTPGIFVDTVVQVAEPMSERTAVIQERAYP
ncbi:MAG: 3-oxoacid CoA-transferase subunit A [Proteobacteria bacterium]|nr:3-oxoacid CoA-transferase subunit A [Pseudomonadota bacterium]MDA1059420.1 3-oxoacid CoA-transferase subunit A [Pseudomonadota bacterium]